METQIFHQCKTIIFKKNPLNKNQNPSKISQLYNNLSQVSTQAKKYIIFQKP
jgi:hypothetical protein